MPVSPLITPIRRIILQLNIDFLSRVGRQVHFMGKPFIDHGLGRNFGLGNNLSVYFHAQFPVPMGVVTDGGTQNRFHVFIYFYLAT